MLSPSFIRKVAGKIDRLDHETLREFVRSLAEERDFFQIIFDSMNEGVLITDQAGLVQYSNTTACMLLGKRPESMDGRPVLDCIDSIDFYNLVQNAVYANERIRNREVSLYIPSDRILNVNIHPLRRSGSIQGHVIIFMDITREKKEQQRLRQAESMSALSSLTAGVAHEIKNPLGAIDIHLQLLQQVLEDGRSERLERDGRRYLSILRDEVARLNTIVVDFLSAVRPIRLKPELVVPADLVNGLAEFVGPALDEAGIALEIRSTPGLPKILADTGLLRQALLNLVKNAQEATKPGGRITISVRREDEMVAIAVEDTGSGIEKDRLGAIFEPYHTSKEFGTGLGLTIVWRIVREHGGEIHVDSLHGEGSCFTVLLPAGKRPPGLLTAPEASGLSTERDGDLRGPS
ncbi:MAG TPA: ATP-binding protein [Spirochaetota bacterium]|nr:ATP-binding protein [Spirochaetota bacterium]